MRLGKLALFCFLVLISCTFVSAEGGNYSDKIVNTNVSFEGGSFPLLPAGKVMKTIHFSEPVKTIEFRLSQNVWAGRPFPEKVGTFAQGMAGLDQSKNVYGYFKLSADKKINSSVLDYLEVKLSVDGRWIKENNLDSDDVDVYFYDKNGWSNFGINVSYFGENSDDYFYVARIPDVGYYSIVEKEEKNIEKILESVAEVEYVEEIEPVQEIEEKTNYAVPILVVLIIIFLIVIYFDREKSK